MPIDLRISAETVEEFDGLLARFIPAQVGGVMPEVMQAALAVDAQKGETTAVPAAETTKGNGRGRKAKTDVAASAPNPSTTQEDTGSSAAESEASASSTAEADPETVSATPSASSPADTAAAEGGEVTVQQLKDAMADLLKAKSASTAMAVLEHATGCKSLTTGSPSVVEKAKDDPSIMRRTLDALVAAKTAA